jgi:hypothetical protein
VKFLRKVQVFEKVFDSSPDVVFGQLCPSREADWINGWTVDLKYTTTGYTEPLCVFRTPSSNTIVGSALWMLTRVEPNELLEGVIIPDDTDIMEHLKIELVDHGDGTCKGIWTLTYTATSEKGNNQIAQIPDGEPPFLEELNYFLNHGELKVW